MSRFKLTYANVMATVAVFLALGGGAMAASTLGKNTVGTKQLKKNAVNGSKVKDQSLTGKDINLAKLGTVPSATNAANATTAGTASALTPPEAVHAVGAPGEPVFQDGSSNIPGEGAVKFQPVTFYRDHDGIVHLEGTAMVGAASPGEIFTLPPGFRPANATLQVFPGLEGRSVFVGGSNASAGSLELSGEVFSGASLGKAVTLSGITFRAGS